jgi:hypothetical protein
MEWTVAIGVDTHKDEHVAVALDRFGAQLERRDLERRVGRGWAAASAEEPADHGLGENLAEGVVGDAAGVCGR